MINTFNDLHENDIVYRMDFTTNELLKYHIINTTPYEYDDKQILLHITLDKTQPLQNDTFVHVHTNNEYETNTTMFGCDKHIFWCCNKTSLNKAFIIYENDMNIHLNDIKKNIENI